MEKHNKVTIRLNVEQELLLEKLMRKSGHKFKSKYFSDVVFGGNNIFGILDSIHDELDKTKNLHSSVEDFSESLDSIKQKISELENKNIYSNIVNSLLFKTIIKVLIADSNFDSPEEKTNYVNNEYNNIIELAKQQME